MSNKDSLYINLKILSQIPENCKIYQVKDGTISFYSGGNRYFQGIARYFKGESRGKTMDIITYIIDTAISVSKSISESKLFYRGKIDLADSFINDKMTRETTGIFLDLQNLSQGLKESINGLKNLKKTYHKDSTVSCRIDVLIKRILDHCVVTQQLVGTEP